MTTRRFWTTSRQIFTATWLPHWTRGTPLLTPSRPFPTPFPPSFLTLPTLPTLSARCYEQSILEIWDFDRDIIYGLSREDILEAINSLTVR